MKQVQIERRNGLVHIDGYCTKKTVKGAMKELMREVAKIDAGTAELVLNNLDELIEAIDWSMSSRDEFTIQLQEVAGYPIMDENDEIVDYGDANWYAYIRFVA